jgi:protein-tyrosine-phosphatase
MAEGFAREFGEGIIEIYSAGIFARCPSGAAAVMKELSIDITRRNQKRSILICC